METVQLVQIIVHWVHVIAGILWFGGFAIMTFMVMPSMRILPPEQQRRYGRLLAPQLTRYYGIVAGIVMLFGLLRGTLLGPIKGLDVLFATPYGLTWLAALILTIGLAVIGSRLIGPTAERMYGDDSLWDFGPGQPPPAGLVAHVQLLRTASVIQLVGFVVVFTLMILLRFDL